MSVINTGYLQAFVILDIHMSNAAKQVVSQYQHIITSLSETEDNKPLLCKVK